jgi:predicted alpha-1,2-mannosidase
MAVAARRTSTRRARRWFLPLLAAAALAITAVPAIALAPAASAAPVTDPASYVDPMIGTGNGGGQVGSVNEYPGPDAPFGMIQWGPDTGSTTPVGYYHDDSTVKGFSLTRLGGVGCNIFQDFRFLPTTQAVTTSPGTGWSSYTSGFSHSQETAKAGYYSVTTANGIQTQLTTATRAALGQFTYPAGSPATMLINAGSSIGNKGSTLQVTSPDTITGSATGGGFCGHPTVNYTVYFAVTFSQPFSSYGTWQGRTATPGGTSVSGDSAGGWVSFGTSSSSATVVNARVAISYVSVAGAESNLATVGSQSFATVRAHTYEQWNSLLGKIDVSGGTAGEETTFYTALYHALLDPSVFSDADGQYMGFDFKVHTVPPGHAVYSDFSGWDIYRSEVPLLALLLPGQASDMMQSLVDYAQQGGWLPKWPTANTYTGMMGGDAAAPMIADAYAFGARDFNIQAALQYMLKGADDTTSPLGQGVYAPRLTNYIDQSAWGDYLKEGYVPTGANSATFGTALTEEFALADFSIGQLAGVTGDHATQAAFMRRAQNWQNVFDPGSGYTGPRGPGVVVSGDPAIEQQGFEEGNAAQYTWMIPQNLAGLAAAMGGRQAAASKLDRFFTELNAGPGAPHEWAGNEVTFGAPWAYDYLGEPWKTQQTVREIINQLYSPTPGGEPGNDDLGAMSSWYIWAALGMFPETPGTSTLALGSPLFPQATVHLGNGRTLTINAPDAAPSAPYVQRLDVNGSAWPADFLPPHLLATGGTLDYTLSTAPDTSRGTGPQAAPPSYRQGESAAIGFTSPWNGIIATPGQTATARIGVQSQVQRPVTAAWSATAPAGVTVSPSSGTLNMGPGTQATQPVTIRVSGNLSPGSYPVHVSFTGAHGHEPIIPADLYVNIPSDLASHFNNIGVTDNANPSAGAFASSGKTYSAQALAAVGITPGSTVSYHGTTFTWPDAAPGTPNNVEAGGQLIGISGTGSTLAFLGASTSGTHGGTGTVYYTDGSTQQFTVSFSDWWNPASTDQVVVTMPYQNQPAGQFQHPASLYYTSVPIQPGKQVAAVALPATGTSPGPGMHIFAIAIS